jgi:hypothetical protein
MIPIMKDLNVEVVEIGDLERTGENLSKTDENVKVRIILGNDN